MNSEMEKAARQAKTAYMKQWRDKNRDKVRANNMRYWARRAEKEAKAAETEGTKNDSDNN